VLLGGDDRKVEVVPTRRAIRAFLAFEAATFIVAALVHFGILTNADPHEAAATGEGVIAIALAIGLALTWTGLLSVATVGILAQGFALFGTLVGILTIVAGVGPQSAPDIAYHVAISGVLIVGVVVASRRLP
jgi:hypothetical protein